MRSGWHGGRGESGLAGCFPFFYFLSSVLGWPGGCARAQIILTLGRVTLFLSDLGKGHSCHVYGFAYNLPFYGG